MALDAEVRVPRVDVAAPDLAGIPLVAEAAVVAADRTDAAVPERFGMVRVAVALH